MTAGRTEKKILKIEQNGRVGGRFLTDGYITVWYDTTACTSHALLFNGCISYVSCTNNYHDI